ncbi:MAG: hypothetical protein RJA70_431 [Pseudomonadota bacterium]|jgi:hypothetical protein
MRSPVPVVQRSAAVVPFEGAESAVPVAASSQSAPYGVHA